MNMFIPNIKKLLFLFIGLIVNLSVTGQNLKNFVIEDSKVHWQHIYTLEYSQSEFLNNLRLSGDFLELTQFDSTISGDTKPFQADLAGAGFTNFTAPMYISGCDITGFVTIELKQNKYRVTLKNIKFIQRQSNGLFEKGVVLSIEDFALKSNKKEYRRLFGKSASQILDYTFIEKFKIKKAATSDW